ncbi:MAG: hypothetical protein KME60_24140 [Cyanomargarita calcarea GSE-NOS-MK-12-04C]|jgi:hypothetical protein|uniref:Uncharacterized protein n=1 Tax=Cyanomargarita calcarea GSE-NOS-MK-12-04C TaxID=2839659 RepID=A0A951QQ61_9CYAN|nr:hypothetical protein [Cyanomargarita calcarea GSE-NOS-MK-12-04C]
MTPKTRQKLLEAYDQLQATAAFLYEAMQEAAESEDHLGASLLEAMADKIFEEAENINTLVSEWRDNDRPES